MTTNLDNEFTRIWDITGNSQKARIKYEGDRIYVELESGEELVDFDGVLYQE